ncbi:MAG: flagellar protein FlaG [Magnetococcus sp. DMHC-1]|nr:flagellar protein FlaG [Magnetococcales bacterium]
MSDVNNIGSSLNMTWGYVDGSATDGTRRSGVGMESVDRREVPIPGVTEPEKIIPEEKLAQDKERDKIPGVKSGQVERSWLDAKVEEFNKSLVGSTALQFRVDEKSQKLVVRVVDKNTDEVVNQFPSESMLALSRRMKDLEGVLYDAKV